MIPNKLVTIEEASKLIEEGHALMFAGDEASLKALPKGQWIGGTIPYFMTKDGGVIDQSRLFMQALPKTVEAHSLRLYDSQQIRAVYEDGPQEGISFIIIPASTDAHLGFASEAHTYPGFLMRPLVGWISGVLLDDLGSVKPGVMLGTTQEFSTDKAVVLHGETSGELAALVDIVNIFEQGDGDTITFDETGFSFTHANVNGERVKLADYMQAKGLNTQLPLVADYYGAMVNVSFQGVNEETKEVAFYAPLFPGVEYKLAAPISDYAAAFDSAVPDDAGKALFSCNCILNFLYAELEGKQTKDAVGPITFGEIAYQLLNQTLVYVDLR